MRPKTESEALEEMRVQTKKTFCGDQLVHATARSVKLTVSILNSTPTQS